MSDTSYEILATKPGRQTSVPNRLLLVPNIDVFFDHPDEPNWSIDRINEVMSWSDFPLAQPRWSRLIIASPRFSVDQYINDSYRAGWQHWFSQQPNNGSCNWLLYHNLNGTNTRFNSLDEGGLIYLTSGLIYSGAYLAVDQHLVTPDTIWMEILHRALGNTRFPGWFDNDYNHNTKPLTQRFADGDTVIKVNSLYGRSDTISQVYIVDRDRNGEVEAKAYVLPRSLDSSL